MYRIRRFPRTAGLEKGFTLIELLIVIVVLGILAAVVIFALGGITGKTAIASCQADGATVSVAIAAFENQNPGYGGTGTAITSTDLTTTATTYSGPYVQSWPSNDPHYAFAMDQGVLGVEVPGPASGVWTPATALGATLSTGIPYKNPGNCSTVS